MGRKSIKENKTRFQLSRENAGFTREGAAATLEFISADRIEKIENEKTFPRPEEVIAMSDEEVWKGLTGGLLTDRPADKSPSNASEIESAVRKQIVNITVPTRAWENAGDSSNMKIIKKEKN